MHFSTLTGVATLLALAPSAIAMGTATVINNCGYPIYFASVNQQAAGGVQQLQGSYSQTYSGVGNGVSIKLSPTASTAGSVSQFEFTLGGDGKINYDISNINGYPFSAGGMSVVPSMQNDPNNPTCVPINCPAGQSVCSAAYNAPNDVRTMVCDQNSNLVLTMCPGGAASSTAATTASVKTVKAVKHVHRRVHSRELPTRR